MMFKDWDFMDYLAYIMLIILILLYVKLFFE